MGWTEVRFTLACLLGYICMTAAVNEGVQTEDVRTEFGESATLKCIFQSDAIEQVTWKKTGEGDGATVATYTKNKAPKVEAPYLDRLNVSTSDPNKTAITIYKTGLEDVGCYLCVFNVFPGGANTGKVCLSISGEVLIENSHKVKLGDAITLRCYLRKSENLTQVSWEKDGHNIGIYRDGRTKIEPPFQKTVSLNMESPQVSTLTIQKAAIGDEGEYKCVFNIFPKGSLDGRTKLQVHSLANCLQPEMMVLTLTLLSALLWLYW